MSHGTGALNKVEFGSMGAADVFHPGIASDARDHFNPHSLVIIAENPGFTRQVEFSEDIDRVWSHLVGVASTD